MCPFIRFRWILCIKYQFCLIFYIIKPQKKHKRNSKKETTRIPWLLFLFVSFKKKWKLFSVFLFIFHVHNANVLFSSAHGLKRIIIFVRLTFHFTLASHFIIWFCCVLFSVFFCYSLGIKEAKKKSSSSILTHVKMN